MRSSMKSFLAATVALLLFLPSAASAHPAFRGIDIPPPPPGGAYKCSVHVMTGGPNNAADRDQWRYNIAILRSESQWNEPATLASQGERNPTDWAGYYWWHSARWIEVADPTKIPATIRIKLAPPTDPQTALAAFTFTTKNRPASTTKTPVTIVVTIPAGYEPVSPAPLWLSIMDGREEKSLDKPAFTISAAPTFYGSAITVSIVGLYSKGAPVNLPLELVLKKK